MSLRGKHIVLGITGSIAAYKSAFLTRLLKQAGAEVQVIMTEAATEFIAPLTLATLSERPVKSEFTEDRDAGTWTNHVEVGLWGDAMIIAPCSAHTLGKMVSGTSDNFLMACYLSAKCPVFVAPAMDRDMFLHPATQSNLERIVSFGHHLIDAETGELASGLEGKGRMAEPASIVSALDTYFSKDLPLRGKTALVTAGPTYERIDPVRFIGNFSSGKMGYAVAEALRDAGAAVTLISGPSALAPPQGLASFVSVESAAEMLEACQAAFASSDVTVMSAAVADYRPAHPATEKIKKHAEALQITLEKTTDILGTLGKARSEKQVLVGFALETENAEAHGWGKLERKHADLIVLNSLRDEGAGFGHDTNRVTFLMRGNKLRSFELKSKAAVAQDIVEAIVELIQIQC